MSGQGEPTVKDCDCEVCELAVELAEERILHQASLVEVERVSEHFHIDQDGRYEITILIGPCSEGGAESFMESVSELVHDTLGAPFGAVIGMRRFEGLASSHKSSP